MYIHAKPSAPPSLHLNRSNRSNHSNRSLRLDLPSYIKVFASILDVPVWEAQVDRILMLFVSADGVFFAWILGFLGLVFFSEKMCVNGFSF